MQNGFKRDDERDDPKMPFDWSALMEGPAAFLKKYRVIIIILLVVGSLFIAMLWGAKF